MKAVSLTTMTVLVAACLLGMVAALAHAAADESETIVSVESNHQEENSGKNLGAMNTGSWNSNDNSGSNPVTPVPGTSYSPLYTVLLKSGATGAAAESEIRTTFSSRFGLPASQLIFEAPPAGDDAAAADMISFKIVQLPGGGAAASDAIEAMNKAASGDKEEQDALGFASVTSTTPTPMTMEPPTPAPMTMVPPTPMPSGQTAEPPTPAPMVTNSSQSSSDSDSNSSGTTPAPMATMNTSGSSASSASSSSDAKYSALFTVVLNTSLTGEAGKTQIRTMLFNLFGVTRDQIAFSTESTTAGAISFVILEQDGNTAAAIAALTKAASGDKTEQAKLGFSSASMAGANDDDTKKSTLSTGVLAAIVIGAIVIVVLVAGIIYKVSSSGSDKGTGQSGINTLDEELSPSRQHLLDTNATRSAV